MEKKKTWEVYIIEVHSGKLYTGITTNLERRFKEHLEGKKGARFFHFSQAKHLVFRESHLNRSEASKREIQIKKMTRQQKIELVQQGHHQS